MGIGNGVTDGSVAIIGLFLYTGYVGNEVFLNKVSFTLFETVISMTVGEIMGYALFISQFFAVFLK